MSDSLKYNKRLIESLKGGVESVIETIDRPVQMGISHKDDKKLIGAQKEGIVAANKMIMQVYNHSEVMGVNNSKWIIRSIKDLIRVSDRPLNHLMDSIKQSWDDQQDEDTDSKTFYDNKTKATADFNEISRSIGELDELLASVDDSGNIVLKDHGEFKASYAENHADVKSKAGYNEDIDAVVICPKGTVGEIREVYGLRIALPEVPDSDEFWNNDVSEESDQYWVRKNIPSGLKPEAARQYDIYIKEQYRLKHEGVWFYNNGEPTYLTGDHWFLLQWGKTDADGGDVHEKGYFHYREAHRDIFYFMQAVWVDKRSLGMIYVKTRRTGATWCKVAFMLSKAIGLKSANFGLTSKTDTDGKAIFNIMLVTMFANLPFFFKPIRISDTPKQTLEFREPQRRITKTNKDQSHEYEALNTELSYKATTDDAYDQYALKMYIGDEFSKWKKPQNILNHWRMISRAMTKGGRITGKAYLLSTVENVKGFDDPDDKDAGMGDKFKYLCDRSNMDVRNNNGRTKSGLYRLFIPCDDNFEGFIDRYGRCVKTNPEEPVLGVDGEMITQGVIEFLEEEAASFTTPEERYNYWRLNPRNLDEAFRIATEESLFSLENIFAQTDYNRKNDNLFIRGNFEWVNGETPNGPADAVAEFVPNQKGRFRISWIPDEQYQNKKDVRGSRVLPGNAEWGAFGSDPYRANETVSRRGSNGGIHGCTTSVNLIGPEDTMFLEYVTKPETVKDFAWDVIKACVFYGMPVLMENAVTDALRYMEEWGFRTYSMNRPDKKPRELTTHERELGGMPSTADINDKLTNVLAWYIRTYVGLEGHEKKMVFNKTLHDWEKFQKKNRTKHDATVSSSLAIFATRKLAATNSIPESKNRKPTQLIKTYKVRKYSSKRR